MKIIPHLAFVALLLVSGGVASVSAQTAPPSTPLPVPPPPVGTPLPPSPAIMAWRIVDENNFDAYSLPSDYQFAERVDGGGFKPGESVTITPKNLSIAPVTVTADTFGGFSARFSFTWVFCGPRGTSTPAPTFDASGSMGSSATTSLRAPSCPLLLATPNQANPRPVPAPGPPSGGVAAGTGSAAPGSTSVSGPTTNPPPPGPGTPIPPGHPVPVSPGLPVTAGPATVELHLQAFGFAPGERVTLQAENVASPAPAAASATADAQGRFALTYTVTLLACASGSSVPRLVTAGDAGTSLAISLRSALICGPCPLDVGPCPTDPSGPLPAPVPATQAPDTSSSVAAISLRAASVRRGAYQEASVWSAVDGSVRLDLRYKGGTTAHLTHTVRAGKRATLRWRVPTAARPGTARVTAHIQPDAGTLSTRFKVR